MNKIFKTKYDVTTGQTKAVSELANNRQVASRVEGASVGVGQPKCGVFFGGILGLFKVLPLALMINGMFSSISYSADVWIEFKDDARDTGDLNEGSGIWNHRAESQMQNPRNNESTILTSAINRTGKETNLRNKDFKRTVAIGSRAVAGGNDTTVIGYRAIVGKNLNTVNTNDSHQGTAVGYRAFSYGNESVSLGNDTVAYGESAISIGSDNVGKNIGKYSKTGLSYDIWKLYRQHGSKFNYTGEYAAIDGANQDTTPEKYQAYLQEKNPSKPFYKTHNWAYGDSSIAIGSRNVAYGQGSLAIGTLSVAKGNFSTALGTATLAFGDSSVALGNESYVYAANSIGVGNNVQAISDGSMVYGYQSYAGGKGSIAIGKRALSNVEPSNKFKQTVEDFRNSWYEGKSTVHELGKLDDPTKHGKDVTLDDYFLPDTEIQLGTNEEKAKVKNGGAVALGYYVYALGENSIALGRQAYSKGDRSIAIGPYAYGGYEKTIAIGYGAKALAEQSFAIGSLSRAEGKDSIAFGVKSKVLKDEHNNDLSGQNSIALGNDSEVTMKNSVAIGNMSNTRYYYTGDIYNPSPSINNRNNAISLPPYIPRGTSYNYNSTSEDGVVSVGGWEKSNQEIGRRRIINVAPGALDSDAATVGQLKALEYAYKEGVVAYYTVVNGKNYKVVKHTDGKFYKANTENGTPLDNTIISADKVFVGPKGAKEIIQTIQVDGKDEIVVDMGDKIKFGHLLDAKISTNSDEAVTGAQLQNVGNILGISNTSDNTKFNNPSFTAVKYVGGNNRTQSNFKGAIDELISAVNKGYKFAADINQNNDTYILGSTIKIVPGAVANSYLGKNLKTKFTKEGSSTAKFEIGLSETPEFKKVTVTEIPTDNNHVVNKKYVDDKLKDAGKSHYLSVKEPASKAGNYNNDGAKGANSIAIGVDVETKNGADSAVVVGHNLSTDVKHAVVVGSNINIEQNNSSDKNKKDAVVAIGSGLKLKNAKSSIVLAAVDERGDTNNTEEGRTVVDGASWAVVIGNKTKVKNGSDIVALGNNINVSDRNNDSLVILGNQATASRAFNSVVLGYKASTTLNDAIALGSNSVAYTDKDVVGLNTVTGQNKSGATHGAWKSKYAALSIGKNGTETRQITGVAAGTQDTDAVNVAQLKEATTHFVSINNGSNSSNNGNNYANDGATKVGAIAIGVGAKAQSNAAIALGYGTQVLDNSNNSIAIGAVNGGSLTKIENADWAVAIGNNTKVTGGNDILALGSNINVTNNNNDSLVILGNGANARNSANSVVIGKGARTEVQSAVVIGEDATATLVNSVAIGKGSKTTGDISTNGYDPSTKEAYVGNDASIWKPNSGVFSVGDSSTTTRRITGVAAGSADTDAVNVAQLKKVVSGAAKLKYAANGDANAFTDKTKHKEIDLETKGLNFKDGTYTTASVEDDGVVKFNLNQTAKDKIDGALQKTEANTQYARIDGSNITGKENNWREKLDVYTKGETKSEINAVKTELTNKIGEKVSNTTFEAAKTELNGKIAGKADNDLSNITQQGQNNIKTYAMEAVDVQGKLGEISVSPSSSNNKKTFTVSLDGAIKTKIESIGTGKVEASNNKTVTGGEVHTAIEGAKTELNNKINEKVNTTTFDQAKTELTNKIGEKVSNTTFETVKTQLKTKIDGKADKSLSDINDAGRKVIKDLITVAGEDKIEVTTANDDNTSSAKKFTVKLNEDTKNKINSIGTGKVEASDNNTVTGKVVHDAIKNSKVTVKANDGDSYITVDGSKSDDINSNEFKIGLNLNTLTTKLEETFSKKTDTFGLMGNDSQAVTKTLNNTIKIEGSESVASSQTNIYVSKKDQNGLEIKLGETLSGISSIGKDENNKISFNTDNAKNEITYTVGNATGTATYKFGKDGLDLGSKKITNVASGIGDVGGTTTNLDNVLKGTPEETTKLNAANVEDLAKVAAAIITKGLEFEDGNGNKVNRKLGETLKLVGEKGATVASNSSTTVATAPDNITVVAKKSKTGDSEPNDTLEIRLAKDLKGIASIENTKDKSKIELKDDGIDLTTSTGKTVKVKDNALEGVSKISAVADANANSIDLANGKDKKNVVITADGKQLTIAKDGTNGKEGISLTGLTDRKVDENGYGTNGNAGRAATESALLDLKTKGLTFEANQNNSTEPKKLQTALGETLKITGKDGDITDFDSKYSLDNVATKIDVANKAIRIGLLKTPRFDALELGADSTKKISLTPNTTGDTLELKLTGAGNDTNVKISGVANGTGDNDAINKSQLNSVVTALGGSATIETDGKVTGPTYTLANGGTKNAVGEALTALDTAITTTNSSITTLGNASIKFSDGINEFTRANNESDKTVKIVSGSNVTVLLDNKADSNKTGKFTISLNKELTDINSITLKSSGDANSKTGKITVDTTGNVKVQHGEGAASKIVAESDFNELKTSDEITVTGGGKVFGGETKLSLNDNSIAGTKLKNATISEAKLDSDLTAKLNREFQVKVDTTTSENLIGNTLEFAKDSNLTVVLDSANKKITYGLSSTLTGITSIESAAGGNGAKSKITLNADHIVSDKDIYVGSKGNDESNKLVKKSELTSEISTIKNNITNNINTLSENKLIFKDGNTSFERANNTDKNIVFKGEGNVNVKLATDDSKNTGTFTISVNETSSINVEAGKQKEDGSTVEDRLTTEKAVVDYVKVRTFKLAGNDSSAVSSPLDGTINIKGDASTTSDQGNIYVSKGTSDSELKIQLGKNLTGIESIKKSENGAKLTLEDNKLELSPEKDVKVTLEKDGQKTTAKATGLSTIGNDGDNALVFNTGNNDNITATLKVGGSDLTFTKENKGIKLSGLSDGKIDDGSKDVITGNQLNALADKLGVGVESTSKTGFTQPDFTAIKGGADSNKKQTTFKGAIDDLISAVNKGMKFQGNDQADVTVNLDGTLKIVGKGSNAKNINVADNNIKVS
ncbi:hypothetical protein ACE4RU_03955, partial [Actinobacillus seminis]|uniref:hypothetical protein n=1 Tax=Actinobacillus seminis TaxID=722 RepID=UPI003B9656A3